MPAHAPSQAGRLNALKHGIFARQSLITTGDAAESVADFEALDAALTAQTAPQGAIEQLLVEHLVAFAWRWRRVLRFETAATASEVQHATSAVHFDESVRDPSAFYGVSLHARPRDLAAELDTANDLIAALDAPDPLAQDTGLCGHALATAEYLDTPLDGLLGAEPPWRQRPAFDPALVEQAIAAACDRSALARSAFWALARPSVEAARDRVLADIEQRDARLRSAQALATLPSAAQLDTIHRYEAHLLRQFHRALSELHRIQSARAALPSEPVPPPGPEAPLPCEGRGRERGHEDPGIRGEPAQAGQAVRTPLASSAGEGPGVRRPPTVVSRSARRASERQRQRALRRPPPQSPRNPPRSPFSP